MGNEIVISWEMRAICFGGAVAFASLGILCFGLALAATSFAWSGKLTP